MNRLLVSAFAIFLGSIPARADEKDVLIEKWYVALQAADTNTLGELLAANAVIKLNDIGTSQTKAEFIESMPEWKTAIKGGSIQHKPDGDVEGARAYKVCYRFTSNELMTREVFTVSDGKIEASEQTTLSESCADF